MNSGVAMKYGNDSPAELSEIHLAALASLKGDIVELNKRLQQTERERDLLEKTLAKAQCEQSHLMREHEVVQERTTLRYEERITELHSIIAELNKKIDRLQGTRVREEDECSELQSELSQSQREVNEDSRSMDRTSVSVQENHSTMVTADVDNCSDLNSELQRVLTGLENVVCGRKKSSCSLSVAEVDRHIEQLATASEHCDLAIKTVEEIEGVLGHDLYPNLSEERCRWEKELAGLREENESLTAMLCSKEEELNRTKATMNAIREERDRLRRRVRELQTRLQSVQATGPSSPSRLTSANRPINPSTGELSTSSSSNDIPIAKIAERVKLSKTRSETSSSDRPVLGSEISSIGVSSTVAEHLAHSLQDCSNIQEIFQTLYSHGSAISETKIREFEVETERLNSRIEHLKSQNDLLTITLEECKSNAERMSMLVGKYESNATALRLALQYSEQCIEAYELLLALAESEQSLILGQFQAAGVGSVDQTGEENITHMLKRAHDCRKTAENAAKALLMKLDGSCGGAYAITGCSVQPWESLSSNSHTSKGLQASVCIHLEMNPVPVQPFASGVETLFNVLSLRDPQCIGEVTAPDHILFIDDIIVWVQTAKEVFKKGNKIIDILLQAGFAIKRDKVKGSAREIQFLGMWCQNSHCYIPQDVINKISTMTFPTNKKDTLSFLYAMGFWRLHIAGFSQIVNPLHDVTLKWNNFEWRLEQ
ncbi:colorectal mutant cancer protein isoform X6 [Pogoniulus pusillus]|uniref:colorectal mutant cancer protein isoform X6 n=1 Tax=Pogoniulus pusillus TaxID=488313 RepID=UPI0030B97EFF